MSATPDPYRDLVASRIARFERVTVLSPADRHGRRRKRSRYRQTRAGTTGPEEIQHAIDRERVKLFRECVALARACSDPIMRAESSHRMWHWDYGVAGCVGEAWLAEQGASLDLSETRQKYLADQLDQEGLAAEGLRGSG